MGRNQIEIKEKVPVTSINNGTQKYIINHLLQKIWQTWDWIQRPQRMNLEMQALT